MDSTELHYLTYDPDEVWNEMMLAYVQAGGDILYPGDEKEMLLRSVQADIVQLFAGVDNALRMQTLRYAVGSYLDAIGENRGCDRITASAATATVTITANATGESITLEAGTTMTADGVMFYALEEDFTLSGYQETLTATIICTREGSSGNGLLSGTLMELASSDSTIKNAISSIVVATDAAGGNEKEDDDTYRERIRLYGLASVTTGPQQQYESVAKSVSSVIMDAKALNIADGEVGVYLILSDPTGAAGIIQGVQDALSAVSVRPLTDTVSVYQATDVPYVLNVEYTYDGSSTVASAIAQAASDYQAWQNSVIGRPFNPDRLMAAIYQAGAMRVTWGAGSEFDTGGAVEYTEITDTQRCAGSITLTGTAVS